MTWDVKGDLCNEGGDQASIEEFAVLEETVDLFDVVSTRCRVGDSNDVSRSIIYLLQPVARCVELNLVLISVFPFQQFATWKFYRLFVHFFLCFALLFHHVFFID